MNNDILSKIRNIPTILGVTKNILPPGNYTTRCRHSEDGIEWWCSEG